MFKCPNCLLTYHTEDNLSNHLKRDCVGSEQFKADAKLGRMVRKLPSGFSLLSSANKWVVVSNEWDGDLLVSSFKDTPEEALEATDIGKDNP